jgi:hypothetical protein
MFGTVQCTSVETKYVLIVAAVELSGAVRPEKFEEIQVAGA